MPAPATATDFLSLVKRSNLVSEEQVETALQQADLPNSPESADRMAVALVRAGLLTKFQARQISQGRYKRFTIADKYLLLEHIGTGGMGAVYLCEHILMRRLVAIKVLPLDKIANDQTALSRFHREARAVAALDHPNIVHAFDIDKFDQVHYFVMEYVDGTSLQEIVARYDLKGERFPVERAVHAIAQAASALQHAHEFGLIHRDVKPGNLLLSRNGTVKLLDLGLARFFDHRQDDLTKKFDDNCVLGTADYLSPEQATMDDVDARADVYGLGGTFYFLLTGSSPFPDGTIAQKLVAHQSKNPKIITEFRSDVPKELLAIIRKMMAKDPNARYQTCAEVAEALAPWTAEPIDPPPSSEMPDLCPAVLTRIESSSHSGRMGSTTKSLSGITRMPHSRSGGSGGSSIVRTDSKRLDQSAVNTGRSSATLPNLPAIAPKSKAAASKAKEKVVKAVPPPNRFRLAFLLLAVALVSALVAGGIVSMVFFFLVKT
jgi:eukaryotic-like serine/threonine-protein kinase